MNNKESSTSSSSNNKRQGVADYFAILGVGEDLVWRHAQQKDQHQQQPQHVEPSSSPSSSPTGQEKESQNHEYKKRSTDIPEVVQPITSSPNCTRMNIVPIEDDAMLLERFYREIVTCDIIVEEEEEDYDVDVDYDDSNYFNRNRNQSNIDASLENTSTQSATATATAATATAAAETEGWIVVRKTRPIGTDSNPTITHHKHNPPKPSLWKKGTIWESNLNPSEGLMGNILRTKHERDAIYEQEILHRTRKGGGSKNHPMASSNNASKTAALKNFLFTKNRVQSTFQSKTPQWLHHHYPERNQYNPNGRHHRAFKKRSKFYLTYKRRSPDEPNVRAVADLALYYVRIHKSTIVDDDNVTTFSGSVPGINDYDTINAPVLPAIDSPHNSNTTTSAPANMMTATASAVGRNGIRASTALFNAGRQAVSNRWSSNNPQNYQSEITNRLDTNMNIAAESTTTGGNVNSSLCEKDEEGEEDYGERGPLLPLRSMLDLPCHQGKVFEEWIIPKPFSHLRFLKHNYGLRHPEEIANRGDVDDLQHRQDCNYRTQTTTVLFPEIDNNYASNNGNNQGIEAVDRTPDRPKRGNLNPSTSTGNTHRSSKTYDEWKERVLLPCLFDPCDKTLLSAVVATEEDGDDSLIVQGGSYDPQQIKGESIVVTGGSASFDNENHHGDNCNYWKGNPDEYLYVPILAIRRQTIGDEERYKEDPALIDLSVSVYDEKGIAVLPSEEYQFMTEEEMLEDENGDGEAITTKLVHKTKWTESRCRGCNRRQNNRSSDKEQHSMTRHHQQERNNSTSVLGALCILVRHNVAMGFCDAAFKTQVLDRFPHKNYKGLPLPEEELPMFCYPTGCRLYRAKYSDAPLPQYYGFVVKNERGDSIYVSCVSFMEPLTNKKKKQLSKLSEKRRRVSLPHKIYWARKQQRLQKQQQRQQTEVDMTVTSPSDWITVNENNVYYEDEENSVLTAFDQMTTFENKTICLISRYPYWTAFRRFLSHLHSVSACSSELPLERYISHLLLSVPVPKPGGPIILIPLPTFSLPIMFHTPPRKDLPLVDLPFERLVACLDVPTIITIVIGFLALERKVIVMSKRPSLVLDVCECLRALLFPFDLVAPYVPRLTEPFMSCLEFPGNKCFRSLYTDAIEEYRLSSNSNFILSTSTDFFIYSRCDICGNSR